MAVAIGNSATLTCSAAGIPPPTIRWFRGTMEVGEGAELTVGDVGGDEAGTYTCRASNDVGRDASANAELAVFGKGSITS